MAGPRQESFAIDGTEGHKPIVLIYVSAATHRVRLEGQCCK